MRRIRWPADRKRPATENVLNQLCRRLVVVVRDRSICQRCGTRPPNQIQWAHVLTRTQKWAQWDADFSMALCSGCHFWFDANKGNLMRPSTGLAWWMEKFPDRATRLMALYASKKRPKVDREALKLWLEAELKKREVFQ